MGHSILDSDAVFVVRIVLFATLILTYILSIGFYYLQENQKNANGASGITDTDYPESALPSSKGPIIKDTNLKAEIVFKGLAYPTGMAFLDQDDILVIEKDTGIVRRIVNGVMLQEPLLDVNVATQGHRGILGIAVSSILSSSLSLPSSSLPSSSSLEHEISNNNSTHASNTNIIKYVFLYYTAAATADGEDIAEGKQPLGNVVYRYEFLNNKLINPKLLLDLPATPGSIGNGGKILLGPHDKNLYITIGGVSINGHQTKAQNVQNGRDPDGTSGILIITQDGKEAIKNGSGILGNKDPINKYYAYGIWNSFGIDFDPLTGKLWDTENGVVFGDEINLVEPGFNSGWNKIDGIWLRGYAIEDTEDHAVSSQEEANNLLVNFGGKGKYSLPEFTWFNDVGPTAIKFFNSDKLGKQYENDIFVGDIINGNIYHFELDQQRTGLLLSPNGPLADKVVSSYDKNIDEIIFGKGFGGITDIQIGPEDGYLYILTFDKTQGTIYRMVPTTTIITTAATN
jgi:aldose sugar dehydrogenase